MISPTNIPTAATENEPVIVVRPNPVSCAIGATNTPMVARYI
jgi:hypothetical protein